jgi:hypothetical protein
VTDIFGGTTQVEIRRGKRICNPADKNGEDPGAPLVTEHLKAYEINQVERFTPVRGVNVTNQFGPITLNLTRPDYMLIPTAKSLIAVPPPIVPTINHYKCYTITRARFRREGLAVTDQFGDLSLDIKRPVRFCVAADKNGEGIKDAESHLLCYQVRPVTGSPRFQSPGQIFTNNQVNEAIERVFGPRELCVPTTIDDD